MSQQHLHFDLSVGARAEMILGALLALGAPRAAALDALGAVGLAAVGLEEERVRRGALVATSARLLIPGEGARASVEVHASPRAPRRGRIAKGRRAAVLHGPSKPAIAAASSLPVPGALVLPQPPQAPPRLERMVDAWRAGAAARVLELPHWLLASDLPPVQKALAHKAARRLASALVQVSGDEARLLGLVAVRLVAEITAVAALVDALSPAAITASPIALSATAASDEGVLDGALDGAAWPSPSPWVLEILAGVPLLEHDRPWVSTDPAGAACAWALVHRFGARGVTGFSRQGIGAARLDAPGGGLVARALLGPPVPLATRAGERSAEPCAVLGASVWAEAASPALLEELRASGALDVGLTAEVTPLGARPRVAVQLTTAPSSAEALCERLWRAGAVDVVRSWADRWTPGRPQVTGTDGRATTEASKREAADEDDEDDQRDDHGR